MIDLNWDQHPTPLEGEGDRDTIEMVEAERPTLEPGADCSCDIEEEGEGCEVCNAPIPFAAPADAPAVVLPEDAWPNGTTVAR